MSLPCRDAAARRISNQKPKLVHGPVDGWCTLTDKPIAQIGLIRSVSGMSEMPNVRLDFTRGPVVPPVAFVLWPPPRTTITCSKTTPTRNRKRSCTCCFKFFTFILIDQWPEQHLPDYVDLTVELEKACSVGYPAPAMHQRARSLNVIVLPVLLRHGTDPGALSLAMALSPFLIRATWYHVVTVTMEGSVSGTSLMRPGPQVLPGRPAMR